jgi:hypothetical protein
MSIIHTLSCLLLLVGLLSCTDAFGVQPKGSLSSLLSESTRRRSSPLRYQNEESPTSSISTPAATESKEDSEKKKAPKKSSDDIDEWDLREDWALQDSVPRYTVGKEAVTFWTQLRHSTPELARRTEAELEQRYKEWYSSAEDSLLVECGHSPMLLSDWRVSTAAPLPSSKTSTVTTPSTTMMSGSLPNGSQIWFPLKMAGTIGDDPMSCAASPKAPITQDTLDDCFISASMTMHTSSYAESTGGIVYELGAPRCEAHRVYDNTSASLDASMGLLAAPVEAANTHHQTTPDTMFGHLDRLQKNFVSEASRNIGTLSTVVAASTMSACLALGYANGHMGTTPSTPSVTQNRQGDVVAAATPSRGTPVYYTRGATEMPELTVAEKRARAELKVGRDKRSLVLMQDRLQKDEAQLKELQKEEYRLEAAEWGF